MPAESHQSTKQEKHVRTRKKTPFQHPLDSPRLKRCLGPLGKGPVTLPQIFLQAFKQISTIFKVSGEKPLKDSVSITCKIINGKFGAERQ